MSIKLLNITQTIDKLNLNFMSDRTSVGLSVSTSTAVPVAVAIIYQDDKYLMQLRDNLPTIAYPGVWGLFGGHLDPGEKPQDTISRELIEEINYPAEKLTPFRSYGDSKYMRYVFSCPLTIPLDNLELREGEDLELLTLAEVEQGFGYSQKLQAPRPLGDIHRQIILDFVAK